jgi:tripartite-type tricarboxylate transporter receptor subunit TctC
MNVARLVTLLLVCASALPAAAQDYPSGPIRIIAPSPPGSPRDIRARWVAERLATALGQPVIVENKAGAGGNIGMQAAAKSPADGHTLVIVDTGTLAQNPHLYQRTGYDALADFIPVTRLVDATLMMAVHPDVPARSVAELIQLAREKPGKLSYGSSGIGTPPHLAGELFRIMAGIEVVHVPYKGAAPALADLLGGRITYTIDSPSMQIQPVNAGKLRALAVTGASRSAVAPDVPTFIESGLAGYEYRSWMGIAVPAGTPKAIVTRLNQELVRVLRQPDAKAWFAAQGGDVVGDEPEAFAAVVRADHARWGKVIREAGIAAE